MPDVSPPPVGFAAKSGPPLVRWEPDPNSDAAHAAALESLRRLVDGAFLPAPVALSTQLQGNVGEFLTFFVGLRHHQTVIPRSFTANASAPLINISRDGIDIVWVFLGAKPADDVIALQEVKTTCTDDCRIADGLLDDYRRLFGTYLPTTLAQRLRGIKARLDVELGLGDLARRLDRFIQPSVAYMQDTRLLPTLVYDSGKAPFSTASKRVAAVRQTLLSDGWAAESVVGWTIELDNLQARFERLCAGDA